MKLHRLLQKCSFFLIKLAAFQASGFAYMKLHFKSFFFRSDWTLAARRPGYHPSISSNRSIPIDQYLIPNPDKPERLATKAPRHKQKMSIIN